MPIWGKLSDAYGRKRFFMNGMVVFLTGSMLCGQSHSMTELILFRAFQGIGAGAMMPITQAIIGDIFPPTQRAKWAGVLMSVFALATIVGPLLGGWITDSSLGWRWTFYVNAPVGVLALAFAAVALPGHMSVRKHRIDYAGSALLVAAAVPLLLGLSWGGNTYPWQSWQIIGLFAFSVVMWVAFYFRERGAAEPVINPRLFENSIFTVSAVAGALQMAAMFGAIMFLPLFVQGVLGKSATNSGIILMPLMLGAILSSITSGQILARTGKYKVVVIVGYLLSTAGAYLLSRMSVDTTWTTLTRDMVVMGLGMGVGMSAFTVIVQNQYPSQRLGEVSAGLQFFRSIGGTVGMAVFGTVLNNQFAAAMKTNLPPALQDYKGAEALNNPQVLLSEAASQQIHDAFSKLGDQGEALFTAFMQAVRLSLDSAIGELFLIASVIGVIGLIVVLFLREDPLRTSHLTFEQEEMLAAEAEAGATGGFTPEGSVGDGGQDPAICCGPDEESQPSPQ